MPQEIFKELLKDIFKTELKEKNWKKKGQNFLHMGEEGLCQRINFQKSRFNTKNKVTFYINFGVGFEEDERWIWKRARQPDMGWIIDRKTIYSEIKSQIMSVMQEIIHDIETLSEWKYNELAKANKNAEYLRCLDRSFEEIENNQTISFALEELQEMESDSWEATQEMKDFMEKRF